ncbi:MAG: (Fe-S)-binding protein [Desulfobacterota bacterium]|nr:(Fe-S)-binding protein [Thermodesulfobacteriota bacterium]
MKELNKVRRFIYNCKKCGVCGNKVTAKVPYVCPVRQASPGFEHFYARGKIIIAQGVLEGRFPLSPDLITALYSCTLCGNCTTQCGTTDSDTGEQMVATTKIVEAMRSDVLAEHPEWVPESYRQVLRATQQYDNPWAMPRASREKWYRGLDLIDARREPADIVLFTGCTIPSSPELSERAKKAVMILNRAGIRVGVLGKDEVCCGSVQRKIGDKACADELMRRNIATLNRTGCSKVVTLCAGCYTTLHHEYKAAGTPLSATVCHIVTLLSELLKNKKLTLTRSQHRTIAYHDPCHLGRHAGIFNPPRDILRAIPSITLVERRATREHTICCGAGGGMRLFEGGRLAVAMGEQALAAARQAGAHALVTACPFCETNLAAAAQTSADPLPVFDIVDLVYDALGA